MKSFNLSDWALETSFARLVFHDCLHVGGTFRLPAAGAQEDPDFTIKTMVIQAQWPGASAEEVTRQVTDGSRRSSRSWNPRLHQERDRRGPNHRLRLSARHDKGP